MSTLTETIHDRLREEICALCHQDHPQPSCLKDRHEDGCPLLRNLDRVIDVVSGLRDYSLEPYRERVRNVVCESCSDAKGRGYEGCDMREAGACILDTHFPKVVAIIEKELARDPGLPD